MYQQKFAAHLQAAAPLLGRVEQEYHQAKTIYKDPGADKRRKGQIAAIYAAHNNCRPWKLFAYVAVQAPIFLSFFFGIKDLVRVFPDITSGGMLWALDLSASDPYNVLPVLASFSFLAVLESNLRSRQVLRLVPSCPPELAVALPRVTGDDGCNAVQDAAGRAAHRRIFGSATAHRAQLPCWRLRVLDLQQSNDRLAGVSYPGAACA